MSIPLPFAFRRRIFLVLLLSAFPTAGLLADLCPDQDGDGYAVCGPVCQVTAECGDCDDTNAAIHPHAAETCDAIDDDCDGSPDTDQTECLAGIGACRRTGPATCEPGDPVLSCHVEPGLPSVEICDGIDNDCDGRVDEDLFQDCSSGCGSAQARCTYGQWSACPAAPCCDCHVGPGGDYANLCDAYASPCETVCLGAGQYSVDCPTISRKNLIGAGRDKTILVGDVVEPARLQALTVTGTLNIFRCGDVFDSRLMSVFNSWDDCNSLQTVAFNESFGDIVLGTESLMWGNRVQGGILWGGGHHRRTIVGNVVSGADIGIRLRGTGQIEDNVVTACRIGIEAVDSNYGRLLGNLVGNDISDVETGISSGSSTGADLGVIDNAIRGSTIAGVSLAGAIGSLSMAGNMIDASAGLQPPAAPGVGVFLDIDLLGTHLIAENTIVRSNPGLRFQSRYVQSVTSRIILASNIVAHNAGNGVEQAGAEFAEAVRNDVYGNAFNWSGMPDPSGTRGNISVDPRFADVAGGDWSILPDSPCVDAGLSMNRPFDLLGRSRVRDGDLDGIPAEDMGAFEMVPEVTGLEVVNPPASLYWDGNPNSTSGYDVYRGLLSLVRFADFLVTRKLACGVTATNLMLGPDPPVGDGYIYLVAPHGIVSGSLGFSTEGVERTIADPCP